MVQEGTKLKEACWKVRYVATCVVFLGEFFLYYHRITLSIGLVAMVHSSGTTNANVSSKSCILNENLNKKNGTERKVWKGEFQWSEELLGYIMGSTFFCYLISMPVFAKLAQLYGGKRIHLSCLFLTSFFTFISPFAARWNVYAFMTIQSLRGLLQGGFVPAGVILITNWFPKQERGFAYTIAISGNSFGAAMGSYLSGILCESTFLGGWPSAFFVSGFTGVIVSIVAFFYLYDNPSIHPTISPLELEYILTNQENVLTEKRPKTPWKSLLTSIPIYALSYAFFGVMWANSYFLSVNPIFLKTILHYTISQNGLFNALPFLLQIVTSQTAGILSSILSKKNLLSIDKLRKFWTFLSTFGYSICILGIYNAGCNRFLAVLFSVAALAFTGFSYAGCWIVCTDMSPTFAASIEAITCTFGTLGHFFVPVVVGYLTNGAQTLEQWQKMFFITIAVSLSSGAIFIIFGEAKIQPWNDVSGEKIQE